MKHLYKILTLLLILGSNQAAARPEDSLVYNLGLLTNASSGRLAPYMIAAGNYDRSTMKNSFGLDIAAHKPLDFKGWFGWGAGLEILTAYQHPVDFERYIATNESWQISTHRPAPVSIRQAYLTARIHSLFATIGAKNASSKIVNNNLSSGDLILSNNARPIPGLTIGFVDFQNIPFTNGWLQIDGQIMYGKFTDNRFRREQFNYYSEILATDIYYTYKYCYFRTKPSQPFSVIFGMQTAGQFGGQTARYFKGTLKYTDVRGFRPKDIVKMFFPIRGNGNGFYEGNSLGAWSLRASYRLPNKATVAAYWENPFEDGSGIACRNGADGLYGLQFTWPGNKWFKSAVVEYLDLRNQSGPIHYAPGDHVNPSITTEATGADNYFNNDTYGPYNNYGIGIGSSMLVSTIYNADGYPEYLYNRLRGAHCAITGYIYPDISYKIMAAHQKGYANGRKPLPVAKTNTSALAQIDWSADKALKGLTISAKVAFDHGSLRGNSFGGALSVTYNGSINLFKKK